MGGEREREEKGRWRGSPPPYYASTHAWGEEEDARVRREMDSEERDRLGGQFSLISFFTHTHTHTHTYIYIYILFSYFYKTNNLTNLISENSLKNSQKKCQFILYKKLFSW